MWTWDEITSLLGAPVKEDVTYTLAEVFCHHYSVVEGGNVDPYQVGVCVQGSAGGVGDYNDGKLKRKRY